LHTREWRASASDLGGYSIQGGVRLSPISVEHEAKKQAIRSDCSRSSRAATATAAAVAAVTAAAAAATATVAALVPPE